MTTKLTLVFFLGFQATYALGLVLGIGACAWIYFLNHDNAKQVYGAVILLGLGGSTMLVTSLAMTSDLIACNVVGLNYFGSKIFYVHLFCLWLDFILSMDKTCHLIAIFIFL